MPLLCKILQMSPWNEATSSKYCLPLSLPNPPLFSFLSPAPLRHRQYTKSLEQARNILNTYRLMDKG